MKAYEKPVIYTLSHLLFGAWAVLCPSIIYVFVAYQLLQLSLDVRFFGLHGHVQKGNNPIHTARKLFEFAVGYLIFSLGKKLFIGSGLAY